MYNFISDGSKNHTFKFVECMSPLASLHADLTFQLTFMKLIYSDSQHAHLVTLFLCKESLILFSLKSWFASGWHVGWDEANKNHSNAYGDITKFYDIMPAILPLEHISIFRNQDLIITAS